MSHYVVVGGAGRTGRRVTERLLAAGHRVRVSSRRARVDVPDGVEVVPADLARLTAGHPALQGVDGVVVSVEPPYDAAGAEAVMHRGVAALAGAAAELGVPVVLVSQIYTTRPEAYPDMAEVTRARGRGEQALHASGAAYAVVRPGWLHDGPAGGARVEQGDTGDGPVSRDLVARAVVACLAEQVDGVTFELFDADGPPPAWPDLLLRLAPDDVSA